jgi:hypothetical protein
MKTINGHKFYESGEQFKYPEGTPPMPPGIKAFWGMKLVGSGKDQRWVEATETDFIGLMKELGFSEEFIAQSVKTKRAKGGCWVDSSGQSCDGNCSSTQHCQANYPSGSSTIITSCFCTNT